MEPQHTKTAHVDPELPNIDENKTIESNEDAQTSSTTDEKTPDEENFSLWKLALITAALCATIFCVALVSA